MVDFVSFRMVRPKRAVLSALVAWRLGPRSASQRQYPRGMVHPTRGWEIGCLRLSRFFLCRASTEWVFTTRNVDVSLLNVLSWAVGTGTVVAIASYREFFFWEGKARVAEADHNTSQIFLVMGLLPVWTGLRGSSSSDFLGVHCRFSVQSVWFWPSLTVSLDEAGLLSSVEPRRSKWNGFRVNSSARGDISASRSSAACVGRGARLGSMASISV